MDTITFKKFVRQTAPSPILGTGLVRFFLGRIFYVKTTANNAKDIKLGALSIPLTL